MPGIASADTLNILGVDLQCDPNLPPDNGGCGLNSFAYLIKVVIDYLGKVIVLPLAVLMIIWGGFKIIMARGNSSEFAKGRQIITTALIGVAIVFGAGIIVSLVWSLLSNNSVPNP
ncbi:MAG: hypothetical protein AAB407_01550 [Patescibacteria group bacterium]